MLGVTEFYKQDHFDMNLELVNDMIHIEFFAKDGLMFHEQTMTRGEFYKLRHHLTLFSDVLNDHFDSRPSKH